MTHPLTPTQQETRVNEKTAGAIIDDALIFIGVDPATADKTVAVVALNEAVEEMRLHDLSAYNGSTVTPPSPPDWWYDQNVVTWKLTRWERFKAWVKRWLP